MKILLAFLLFFYISPSFAQESEIDFDALRNRWSYFNIGKAKGQNTIPMPPRRLEALNKDARRIIDSVKDFEETGYLWSDATKWRSNPAHITRSYRNLLTVVLAYLTPNGNLYEDPQAWNFIQYTMTILNTNYYSTKQIQYGNWWDWQIGIPTVISSIITLLYDRLTPEQIEQHVKAINRFLPIVDPSSRFHKSANLADVGLVKLLESLVTENPQLFKKTVQDVSTAIKYATYGDGIYPDGSLIQHGNIAYTGSYGLVFFRQYTSLYLMLAGTPYKLNEELFSSWVNKAIDPIIYKGQVMDSVRGRAIARSYDTSKNAGTTFINSIALLSSVIDPTYKKNLQQLVRSWMDTNTAYYIDNARDPISYQTLKQISTLPLIPQSFKHFTFNRMDRDVQRAPGFAFSLSRSSKRIAKYEAINNENIKPWYQGDHIFYLYNNDHEYYGDGYWVTVDPYRLPGLTRGIRKRRDLLGIVPSVTTSYNEWSGGVSWDNIGVAGSTLGNSDDNLHGYKSWFMFPNEIIFMGSDINNNIETETVVDQRRLNKNGTNKITFDGNLLDKEYAITNTRATNVFIDGNSPRSSVGFHFMGGQPIMAEIVKRSGYWTDINASQALSQSLSTNELTDFYASIVINHGRKPKKSGFSYVLIPNISETALNNYQPDFQIITNNNAVHALFHNKYQIGAVNFFKAGSLDWITTDSPIAIMWKDIGVHKIIRLADPIFKERTVTLTLQGYWDTDISDTIQYQQKDNKTLLTITLSGNSSKIHEITLQKTLQ